MYAIEFAMIVNSHLSEAFKPFRASFRWIIQCGNNIENLPCAFVLGLEYLLLDFVIEHIRA